MSTFTSSLAQSTISDTAQVKYHEAHKAPPTMLPGRVTPALLLQWEEHAIAYFDKAKTPEVDKVACVLTCWRDSEIDNFIKMNKTRFRTADKHFPEWTSQYQDAFLKIKAIVVSRECLTVIDHKKLDKNKIFLV